MITKTLSLPSYAHIFSVNKRRKQNKVKDFTDSIIIFLILQINVLFLV